MKHLRKFNEDLDRKEEEMSQSDPSFQFRHAVRSASRNADSEAHQKMIDLLDKYGVDLIKDRRYIALKWAAELGKEEVMDVLLDKLKESGEDMDMIHKMLVPYASGSAWR